MAMNSTCNKNKKRSVRFNEIAFCKKVSKISSFDGVDIESIWYSRKDLSQMKLNYRLDMEKISSSSSSLSKEVQQYDSSCSTFPQSIRSNLKVDSSSFCGYGLEKPTERLESRYAKDRACEAVFFEQELQQEEGINDPEYIADIYYEASYDNVMEARIRGKQWAEEVVWDMVIMYDAVRDDEIMKWSCSPSSCSSISSTIDSSNNKNKAQTRTIKRSTKKGGCKDSFPTPPCRKESVRNLMTMESASTSSNPPYGPETSNNNKKLLLPCYVLAARTPTAAACYSVLNNKSNNKYRYKSLGDFLNDATAVVAKKNSASSFSSASKIS